MNKNDIILDLDKANQVMRVYDSQPGSDSMTRWYWKWDGSGSYFPVKEGNTAAVKDTQACEIPLQSLELLYKALRKYFRHDTPVEPENPGKYDTNSFLEGQIKALQDVIKGFIHGK